jgi:hypothetical protein
LTSYVVTSATQISVKTPTLGCAVTGGTKETVSINAVDLSVISKVAVLSFVAPPSIGAFVAATSNPVITQNSNLMLPAAQVLELNAAGNQLIRIKASGTFAFAGTSGLLSGSLGGKALTSVGFVSAAGVSQTTPTTGDVGNTWIAKTGTGMTVSATPTLSITQASVSRTFTALETGLTGIVAVPTVTSLDVKEGIVGLATTVKITGTNFGTVLGDIDVDFCGVAATPSAVTATLITLTTPTALPPVTVGLAGSSGVCPVVVTRTVSGVAAVSPVNAASSFAFLDR